MAKKITKQVEIPIESSETELNLIFKDTVDYIKEKFERKYNKEIQEFFCKLQSKFMKDKYLCPVCKGKGYSMEPNMKTDPMSGWPYQDGLVEVKCEACKGKGYADHELKPITKIVGWK